MLPTAAAQTSLAFPSHWIHYRGSMFTSIPQLIPAPDFQTSSSHKTGTPVSANSPHMPVAMNSVILSSPLKSPSSCIPFRLIASSLTLRKSFLIPYSLTPTSSLQILPCPFLHHFCKDFSSLTLPPVLTRPSLRQVPSYLSRSLLQQGHLFSARALL